MECHLMQPKHPKIRNINAGFFTEKPSWSRAFVVFLGVNRRTLLQPGVHRCICPRNPRRHPSISRVYTYKDKEYLLLNK